MAVFFETNMEDINLGRSTLQHSLVVRDRMGWDVAACKIAGAKEGEGDIQMTADGTETHLDLECQGRIMRRRKGCSH